MSIVWSPGVRDSAITGLGVLLRRPEWRDSDAGEDITAAVTAALDDTNPLVRMHAARMVTALHPGVSAAELAAKIGQRAFTETNRVVCAGLIDQLSSTVRDDATAVDTVLEQLLETDTSILAAAVNDDLGTSLMALLTYLACVPQTPFAARTIHRWCEQAPQYPATATAFARHSRNYLAAHGTTEQQRAFQLLGLAAQACLKRWTSNRAEHLTGADLPPEQLAELRGAAQVAHEISQQIYFASGAFDHTQGREPAPLAALASFGELAFPVLSTCTKLHDPQTIHHAVETMVFLAGLDESRALQAIAAAIPPRNTYAHDGLAGTLVIDYLQRLLTEQRSLVLDDSHGIAAFRHLLQTFAAAGNQQALALAYTFADVFR
ncbi:hypothetical protein [Actinoplanes sp. NPDC026619]|uniref:hypothetical protein n=1 Tax=Actinoplanes sp. NPDC026619 TaxID=3155798 RepID=UPI003410A42A